MNLLPLFCMWYSFSLISFGPAPEIGFAQRDVFVAQFKVGG